MSALAPIILKQQVRALEADMLTPVSMLMGLDPQEPVVLLESAAVDGCFGRYSLLARHAALFIHCRNGLLHLDIIDTRLAPLAVLQGSPYVQGLRQLMQALQVQAAIRTDLPPITRALYGYLGYGMASLFHPCLAKDLPPENAEACLMLPRSLLLFDHQYHKLHEITLEDDHTPPPAPHKACLPYQGQQTPPEQGRGDLAVMLPSRQDYMAGVSRVRQRLQQGEGIQVVLSMQGSAPYRGTGLTLYRRLRARNASPYMFYQRLPDITLLGASPEVMVRCKADHMDLSPIAGTRPRGSTAEKDALLAEELLRDPKERAEHTMLVDLGRNDLGRVARPGSVRVERSMEVQRFSHVMHLTSHLSAPLRQGLDALDVLAATFPAGTVSGAPKIRAMQIIAETETQARGPYAGCVGWLGLDKDSVHLDTGIIIRSLWLREGRVYWQAGAGIVFDSNPETEADECGHKAAIMNSILQSEEEDHVCAHR